MWGHPDRRPEPVAGGEHAVEQASHQLTRGLLTFLSIAALALATAASWWPKEGGDGGATGAAQIQVQTSDGASACGTLAESPQSGTLRVVTDSQPVDVALGSLARITPVGSC